MSTGKKYKKKLKFQKLYQEVKTLDKCLIFLEPQLDEDK